MTVFLVFMSRQVNAYSLQGLQNRRLLRPQEKRWGGGWLGGLGGGVGLGFLFVLLIGLHERPISCSVLLYFKASVCVNNSVATAYTSLLILRTALTVLRIKGVAAFSTCAILIHTSRGLSGTALLNGVSSVPESHFTFLALKEF